MGSEPETGRGIIENYAMSMGWATTPRVWLWQNEPLLRRRYPRRIARVRRNKTRLIVEHSHSKFG